MEADFSGWATKFGIKCSDGRTIVPGAFQHQDTKKFPLVWQHNHDAIENVLGHVLLEERAEGTYTFGFFNETPKGQLAKTMVEHGDLNALSIYANNLAQRGDDVHHGDIKEVSLCLAGANDGAVIDNVYLKHSGGGFTVVEEEAIITTGLTLEHSSKGASVAETDTDDPTIQEVFDTMSDVQKTVVHVMLAEALGANDDDDDDDETDVKNDDGTVTHADGTTTLTDGTLKHADGSITNADGTPVDSNTLQHQKAGTTVTNLFEQQGTQVERKTLTHSQIKSIFEGARTGKYNTIKESFLAHAVDYGILKHADDYGIGEIEYLFPEAKALSNAPSFVKRRTEWVAGVINDTHHSPFSRVKTLFADITHDEARAKGYIKGNLKKEEFFRLTKRVTTPKTIYKKQKLDRDDIVDITDLDVVAWLRAEMRVMLDEEIARAVLLGDGREVDDEDKIDEEHIRPIAYDDEFFAHPVEIPANVLPQDAAEAILRSFEHYRGTGGATFYTRQGFYTDLLLAKDKLNRRLWDSPEALASALGVARVVPVQIMNDYEGILGIIVNLSDYTIGADKGGAVNMFDDFDIDYNQFKYLIETRISGALTKWKSALVIKRTVGTEVTPEVPTFAPATGVVTIPATVGVVYAQDGEIVTAGAQPAIAPSETTEIEAIPADGYSFPHNIDTDWEFKRNA